MLSSVLRVSRPLTRQVVLRQSCAAFASAPQQQHLVINAVGQDRVGIVSDITGLVIDAGGNVGESQAAKLGNHFSLMMLVTVPPSNLDRLKSALSGMQDMNAAVFESPDLEEAHTPQIGYSGYFTLEGADNPGIVHKMTSALAQHGLSIDKLETDQEIAPHGGTVLFKMRGVVLACEPLASGFDIQQIRDDLMELGDSLNCDVTLENTVEDADSASFYAG